MKKILTTFSLLITIFSINFDCKGAIITSVVASGPWKSNGTWDLGRTPTCGDTIVIPFGSNVNITQNVNLDSGSPLCTAVRMHISGELSFSAGKKLDLAAGAVITVNLGGLISPSGGGGGASESISICIAKVWQSENGALAGPVVLVCPIALPVNLISFTINQDPESFSILWKVAEENNLAFYEVFVSENGYDWHTISKQSGIGTTTIEQNYQYRYMRSSDENLQLYFKLQSTDFNGTINLLAIETAKVDLSKILEEKQITIYPNPSLENNIINVAFNSSKDDDVEVQIADFSGKIIFVRKITSQKGQNIVLLDSKEFTRGNYIVKLFTNEFTANKKLIIL